LSFWHTRARARCLVEREEQKREKCCARKMRRSSNAYCESCENSKKKNLLHGVIVWIGCASVTYRDIKIEIDT
jgi:hypothetical protein